MINNSEIPSNLYDIDMERAILSSIFYSDDAYSEISDIISASDFYFKPHFDIYSAMRECISHDEPIDPAFVKKRIGDRYNDDAFSEILATSAILDIAKYASELKEKAIKRSLIKIAYQMPSKVNEAESSKDLVDDISSEIYALVDGVEGGMIKDIHQIITEVAEELKKQKDAEDGDLVGIDTGFHTLNEYTKGFKKGELIIIAARPGMGKTAFALNIVSKVIKNGSGVVFFSLEMPAHQLMLRMLSAITSIPLSSIMTGKLTDEDLTRFNDECQAMLDRKLFFYDSGYVNIHQVKTQLRKLKSSNQNIDLCVIDYIGLMTSSGNYSERHLQIAEISRGLKLLARELDIPIIALSQLNRGLEARANKRPMLSDLRESGAIEQDADTILFVYRTDFYKAQEENEKREKAALEGREYEVNFELNLNSEKAEIIVGKNRSGALGTINATFQSRFTRFLDYVPSDDTPSEEIPFDPNS